MKPDFSTLHALPKSQRECLGHLGAAEEAGGAGAGVTYDFLQAKSGGKSVVWARENVYALKRAGFVSLATSRGGRGLKAVVRLTTKGRGVLDGTPPPQSSPGQ